MAIKGISRKGRQLKPSSRPLEEYYPIHFEVIGTPEWLKSSFPGDVLRPGESVPVRGKADLAEPRSWLLSHMILGGDTESTGADKRSGLDPHDPTSYLTLLQIGTQDRVFLIEPKLIPEFQDILESEDKLFIFQNAVHDFKFLLKKYGVHLGPMYDTMLAEQLLTSGLMGVSVSLEEQARKYPPHRIISKEIRKQFMQFSGVFDRKMAYYGARDIELMFPIRDMQLKDLARWKMQTAAQDEFNVIPCTAMMELGGVHIDIRVLRLALSYWEARKQELEKEILRIYDQEVRKQGRESLYLFPEMKEIFDLQSPSQKIEALRRIGLDISDAKRETIEELDHPIAKPMAEYSEVTKVTTTYGENLISKVNVTSGRLYPEFNQLGSGDLESKKGRAKKETISTGRDSSDFQQLPRALPRYALVTNSAELELVTSRFRDRYYQVQQGAAQ